MQAVFGFAEASRQNLSQHTEGGVHCPRDGGSSDLGVGTAAIAGFKFWETLALSCVLPVIAPSRSRVLCTAF